MAGVVGTALSIAAAKILDENGVINIFPDNDVANIDTGVKPVGEEKAVTNANTDANPTGEDAPDMSNPPVEALDEAAPAEESPPTAPAPEASKAPAPPTDLRDRWELAPEVYSAGTSAQKGEAVRLHGNCAAYTVTCEAGVFKGGTDEFIFAPGCPEPQANWEGWTPGKKVPVSAKGGGDYSSGITAPSDLCPKIPTVNGRVIHYLDKVQ